MMNKTTRRIIVSLLIAIMTAASVPSVALAYPEGYAETQYNIGKAMARSLGREAVNPSSPHAAATYNAVVKGGAQYYYRNALNSAAAKYGKALSKQKGLYRSNKAGTVMRQTAGYKKATKAVQAADKEFKNVLKKEGALCKVGSVAVSGYCVYTRAQTYLSENHKHSSIEFLNRTLKGIDIGTNIASTWNEGAEFVSIGTGYAADFTDSEGFVELANSWDNWFINGLDLTVDDMNNAVYNFFLKNFFSNYRPAQGVGVYKPNIYLYPVSETGVTVRFGMPGLLTTVIPDYDGVWDVTAEPSGKLKDAKGDEYGFLFYESDIDPQLITLESAYLIPNDDRAKAFDLILGAYGLNEKEKSDFIEFWDEKLDKDTDYLAYEIGTKAVDGLMPIQTDPQPDSVLRLWFAFVPYDGEAFADAQPEPLIREGFTLVEWGGLILEP